MQDALLLHAEEVTVSRRRSHTLVRVAVTTDTTEQHLEQQLEHARVTIEHVPIGEVVDAVPPVREEGDTIVLPVVEERLVVERRLVLVEEVRISRTLDTEHIRQTIACRTQTATITRTPIGDPDRSSP
jgi:uncharacterized protein (TIGR02271 family)